MVGSRHLQGTIISRVNYLLKSGSLKKAPLWFDIVKRFPPPKTSFLSLADTIEQSEIPKITYPDDDIKREFYKRFERAIRDPDSLLVDIDVEETKTQLFLRNYKQLIEAGKSEQESMEEALDMFSKHLDSIREQKYGIQEHDQEPNKRMDSKYADISLNEFYDIFKKKNS